MLEPAYKLEELEIVGYADTLDETTVPQVVPPIFHRKDRPDEYLLPPFRLSGARVERAVVGRRIDFESAVRRGQATSLERSLEPRPDHELWIDQHFEPHYEPVQEARRGLGEIARQQVQWAQEALASGQLAEADRHAQTALAANDRCLNALLIKAIVYRRTQQEGRVKILAEIAETVSPGIDLVAWVDLFSQNESPESQSDADPEAPYVFEEQVSYVAEDAAPFFGSPIEDEEYADEPTPKAATDFPGKVPEPSDD